MAAKKKTKRLTRKDRIEGKPPVAHIVKPKRNPSVLQKIKEKLGL